MRCALVLVGLLSWWPAVASASPRDDFLLCRNVIAVAEHSTTIPERLLSAIAVVESGRRDPGTGSVAPWPWTINVEGVGHVYDSKAAAIAAVQDFQARGVRSIDVGCMQINLLAHPSAFGSLDEAFDPAANARYAARFLSQLYQQTGTWLRATAGYHSLTPEIGDEYARKVLAAWPKEREVSSEPPVSAAAVGTASLPLAALPPGGTAGHVLLLPGPAVASAPAAAGRSLADYRAAPTRLTMAIGLFRRF